MDLDFFSFSRSFKAALAKLKLPPDCTLHEPDWQPTLPPLFWQVTTMLDFSTDHKHVRIWERYDKIAGLQMSRRVQWAYHYGLTDTVDEHGRALRGRPDDPLDIRIDTSGGIHMHYKKQEPHYGQGDIAGLDLRDVQAIDFLRGVIRQRTRGGEFTKIFGFKIKGT